MNIIVGLVIFAFTLTAGGHLLAQDRTIPAFKPNGERVGSLRETGNGTFNLYDTQSRRIGYGQTTPDGRRIDVYTTDGKRMLKIDVPPSSKSRR